MYLMCSWCPGDHSPGCSQILFQLICSASAGLELPFQGCQVLPPFEGFICLSAPLQLSHLSGVLLENQSQLPLMLGLQQ